MSSKLLIGGLLLTLSIGALLLANSAPQQNLRSQSDEFSAWMKQYNIRLADEQTIQYRRSIFYENKDLIEQLNAEDNGTFNSINRFAMYTQEEFGALFKGYQSIPTNDVVLTLNGVPAPAIDWRDHKAVTSVKNQGSCGACWAFSTVGGLEGVYAIQTGNLTSFSPQQLVDCSTANNGCKGGDLPPAYKYVVANGIETEAAYPYTGVNGTCAYNASQVVFKPSSFVQVQKKQPEQLALALNKNPVPICIEANSLVFQFYKKGIIKKYCGQLLDHCVLAVGYDSESWLVKNSWGADWGLDGYVKIAKSDEAGAGVCGILKEPVYPIYKA